MEQEYNEEQLVELLQRELSILREVLGSMQQEQNCLLGGMVDHLGPLLEERDGMMSVLEKVQGARKETITRLAAEGKGLETEEVTENVLSLCIDISTPMGTDIFLLRDQVLSVMEKIGQLTVQNSYLLQSKICLTQDMLRAVQPKPVNPTYTKRGSVAVKPEKTSLQIINREG